MLDFFADIITEQKRTGSILGCYFANFTLELSNENPLVRDRLRTIFGNYRESFDRLLQRAFVGPG